MEQITQRFVSHPPKGATARVVVGIPAFNEARFIGDIVRGARAQAEAVIVVDDGSHDATGEIAREAGASVVRHPINRGMGAAIGQCFREARAREADVLVTIDGDAQHSLAEMSRLIQPILDGRADVVTGSRFLDETTRFPRYRKLGISIINLLMNVATRRRISDCQCGYRAYGRRALRLIEITEPGFAFSVETLIKARRADLVIAEVPVSCRYHAESHTAHPVTHGVGVALAVVRLRAREFLRDGRSRR